LGFRINTYAKCWQIEPGKGNFTRVRMSVSRKNRDTGEYEQDFSGFVMMIGNAHAKSQRLKEGDRIKLLEVDVSNRYDKERNREYIDYKCFDFEFADDSPAPRAQSQAPDCNPVEGDVDEEPPF